MLITKRGLYLLLPTQETAQRFVVVARVSAVHSLMFGSAVISYGLFQGNFEAPQRPVFAALERWTPVALEILESMPCMILIVG
jgi:hypothetical protein